MTVSVRAAWQLYVSGLPPRKIATKLRVPARNVYLLLRRAREEIGVTVNEAQDEVAGALPRCRCGLLLPCNSCLPSVADVAARRL